MSIFDDLRDLDSTTKVFEQQVSTQKVLAIILLIISSCLLAGGLSFRSSFQKLGLQWLSLSMLAGASLTSALLVEEAGKLAKNERKLEAIEQRRDEDLAHQIAIAAFHRERIREEAYEAVTDQQSLIAGEGQLQALPAAVETKPKLEVKDVLKKGKGICLFGDTGSGKSSVVLHLLGEIEKPIVYLDVCDPHDDGERWHQQVNVHTEYPEIILKLQNALLELDSRKRTRRVGQKYFEYYVLVIDEWPSIRVWAKREDKTKKTHYLDVCDEAVLRFGSECRKYDMLVLFCSQSGNVKAMGLEGCGDFLTNYVLIRLNDIAEKYAKNIRNASEVLAQLKQTAYCCMVNDEVAIHPTHSMYTEVVDGNVPQNIKPLRFKTIEKRQRSTPEFVEEKPINLTPELDVRAQLENIYNLESDSEIDEEIDENTESEKLAYREFYAFCNQLRDCLKFKKSLTIRDILANGSFYRKYSWLSASEIRAIAPKLAEQGWLTIDTSPGQDWIFTYIEQ